MPAAVLQRRRNGPEGIASIEKQPISSATVAVSTPVRGCTLIVAACGGVAAATGNVSPTLSAVPHLAHLKGKFRNEKASARVLVSPAVSRQQHSVNFSRASSVFS